MFRKARVKNTVFSRKISSMFACYCFPKANDLTSEPFPDPEECQDVVDQEAPSQAEVRLVDFISA